MEFIDWPQLAKSLSSVPDEHVHSLISQLVVAVQYLDELNIVHRDIKPENIHVSPDFKQLKLLDLGVARAFEMSDGDEASLTDTGQTRPFVATAQYSSPEYLFRLDAPTTRLWKGLNIYQVGAVLHDLIMKRQIFHDEVTMGNRWLVARAVMTNIPSFGDSGDGRLATLKALSSRCLTKDLDTRLAIVEWNDFARDVTDDALSRLKGRLLKSVPSAAKQAKVARDAQLQFQRNSFEKRFSESVRANLLGVCEGRFVLNMRPPKLVEHPVYQFELSVTDTVCILCLVCFRWCDALQENTATLMYGAYIVEAEKGIDTKFQADAIACSVTIQEGEAEGEHILTNTLAEVFLAGLDIIDANPGDASAIHGMTLSKQTP